MEDDGDAVTRKQTSDRVSRIAARMMKRMGKRGTYRVSLEWLNAHGAVVAELDVTRDTRALAASCLSQDETKGKQKKVRK